MSQFLYYIPGLTVATLDRDAVRKAGLGDVFRDCLATPQAFQRMVVNPLHAGGPGEVRSGVLICAEPGDGGALGITPGYHPDRQEWVNCTSSGSGYWLGWERDKKPTSEGLARSPFIPGYEVNLGDGRAWMCPTIRKSGVQPNLPRTMGIDASGEFGMRVMPEFDWAWQLGEEIWALLTTRTLAWSRAFDLCVRALSLNYRVGPREVTALGLINTENFQSVFDAAIDWHVVKELMGEEASSPDDDVKKNGSSAGEPVSVTPGSLERTPITDPLTAIST